MKFSYLRWGLGLGMAYLAVALSPVAVKPGQAAERIVFSLGAIERSISVESLEIYAEEGRITAELAPYLTDLDESALEQGRSLLSQRADLDVTAVAQFAYTPQGDFLLEQIGQVFRTGARLPGGKGLRGAAILAAADEAEGLTILNVIRHFPTPVLRVDISRGLAVVQQASNALSLSSSALSLVEQLSLEKATEPFPSGVSAAELNRLVTRPGPFSARRISMRLKSSVKPVDIYLPQSRMEAFEEGLSGRPAVIISHGLGSDRTSYAYLAQFLAEHGFAVIAVEHPGSSAEQLDALISGRTSQVVPDEEFVSRPLLISQVLNDLEAKALSDKNLDGINFNNIGVIGQSFGGYTALAVAGAPLNLKSLREVCPPSFSVDISLLLQCQATTLVSPERTSIDFYDPRIQAVVAINPITSAIFGPESLAEVPVPVLMIAGSADTVAPALPEQIVPFTWLPEGDRYLLLMEGATHFSTIGVTGAETFGLPPEIIGPSPEIAQRYTQVMSLAFLSSYLNQDSRYQPVLSSAFTTRLSRPEMPLSFISSLTSEQLARQLKP
ncbi:MAG: alpha/beta fold hydrolase [Phormidesmis sp.]